MTVQSKVISSFDSHLDFGFQNFFFDDFDWNTFDFDLFQSSDHGTKSNNYRVGNLKV